MDEQPRSSKKKLFFILFLMIAVPLGGYYGFKAWQHSAMHVSTDNAYVHADVAQITPRLQGTVTDVLVHENWWVKPGQVLVRMDPRDYEVRLAETQAGPDARQGDSRSTLCCGLPWRKSGKKPCSRRSRPRKPTWPPPRPSSVGRRWISSAPSS